jgi:hypothetical protein
MQEVYIQGVSTIAGIPAAPVITHPKPNRDPPFTAGQGRYAKQADASP